MDVFREQRFRALLPLYVAYAGCIRIAPRIEWQANEIGNPISNRAAYAPAGGARSGAPLAAGDFPGPAHERGRLCGCNPRVAVTGLVTNVDGEPAGRIGESGGGPGLWGDQRERCFLLMAAQYSVRPPGAWELEYIKSGFTTAYQNLDTGNARSVEAPPVALWPLPAARGCICSRAFTTNRLPARRRSATAR